jgi:tetratricopeptide (TPR) repeat protein
LSGTDAVAAEFYMRALDMYRLVLPETNSRIARTMGDLIDVLLADGRYEMAEKLSREALVRLQRLLPEDHWYIALHEVRLGRALSGLGQLDSAWSMLSEAHPRLQKVRGLSSPYVIDLAGAMIELAGLRGEVAQREHWRVAYARGLAGTVSIPTHDQLRIAIGPDRQEAAESLVAMHECLLAITRDCAGAAAETFELIHSLIDPAEPAAALVADVLTSWSHSAGQQGYNDYSVERAIMHEAERLTDRNEHRHPRKSASTYWSLSANHERFGEHEAGVQAARRALEYIQAQQAEHYAFESAADSLLAIHLAHLGRLEEAWDSIIPAYKSLLRQGGPAAIDTIIAFGRALNIAAKQGWLHDADALIASHFELLRHGHTGGARRSAAWRVIQVPGLSDHAYREALQLLDGLSDELEAEAMSMLARGAALCRLGAFKDAQRILQEIEFDGPNHVVHLSFCAVTHHGMDEHDRAAAALERLNALRVTPPQWWTKFHDMLVDEVGARLR